MLIFENIRLALFSLKANKMRALLTMLGIIIGIAAVIAIMTVGDSLTGAFSDSMSSMGASNINIGVNSKIEEDEITPEGYIFKATASSGKISDSDYITKEMLDSFVDLYGEEVLAISAEESLPRAKVEDGDLYANIWPSGVSAGYFAANNVNIIEGRLFDLEEYDERRNVAIVSDYFVDNMFEGNAQQALGQVVNVDIGGKSVRFTIIGVYEYQNQGFMLTSKRDMTTSFYIPLRTAMMFNHSEGFRNLTVVVNEGVNPDDFAGVTQSFFNNAYYRDNHRAEVMAYTLTSIVDMMSNYMNKITIAIAVIAGIALLVGGIGVMNIMLVSITERTREIGTRKALGAPNSSIRLQFIVESIVICIIGGIIGIILGTTMGMIGAKLIGAAAVPSIKSIVLSISFSTAIGIFFGYYPANKAAKMDPIDALRYE